MAFLLVTVAVAVAFCTAAFGFSEQLTVQLTSGEGEPAALTLPEGTITVTPNTTGTATASAIDDGLVDRVRGTDGVVEAFGILDQPVSFRVSARQQPDRPVQLRGLVLSSTWDPRRWAVVEGRPPAGPDEVAVDVGGALVGLAPPGSRARLQLPTGTRTVDVVGLVAPADGATAGRADGTPVTDATGTGAVELGEVSLSSAHVVLPAEHAADLLGTAGKVDRVSVVPDPGADVDDVVSALRAELPDGVSVVAVTDRAQSTQQTVAGIDRGVRSATTAFAVVTALVAAFAVANVQTVVLAQRTRELALLRLVGAGRGHLARVVTAEALAVGVAATALGLAAGAGLAWLAVTVVDPLGVRGDLLVTASMVRAAVLVGMVVTLAGGAWPALRASRAAPLDAFSDTGAGAEVRMAGPVVPAARALSTLLVPVMGVTARLGIGNVSRRPARSAAAGATLMVTLVMVAAVATLGAGARQTVQARFDNAGAADLYLERRGLVRVDTGSLASAVNASVGGISAGAEIVSVDGVLEGPGGTLREVATSGLGRLASLVDLELAEGDPARGQAGDAGPAGDGAPDGALLSVGAAGDLGVGVGDRLTLRSTSGRETEVTVVATYRNTGFAGPAVVSRAAAEAADAEGTFELAALEVADGAPARRVAAQARRVADAFPKVRVHSPQEFAELNTEVTDTVLRVIGVLLAGSVGIGFLGLASTQALATLERRRELVMLRAVGASRPQVRALIGVEAAAVAAVSAVMGLVGGAVLGLLGARFVPPDLVAAPVVPWALLVSVGLAAVGIAGLVSLVVSRGATRLPPAEAGRAE